MRPAGWCPCPPRWLQWPRDGPTTFRHCMGLLTDAALTNPGPLVRPIALARLTADRALAAGILDPPAAQRLLDVLAGAPR